MDLVIHGGCALTVNFNLDIIEDAVIEITKGRISKIYSKKNYRAPRGVKTLDAKNALILPGFINLHTHIGMSLLRGIADDKPLEAWLMEDIFPLERKFSNREFAKVGTQLACAEMISSGITTFSDMYYFQTTVAKVVHDCGMRAVCGSAYAEISGVEKAGKVLARFEEFLDGVKNYPRITPALAPHSVYGLSRESWEAIIRFAQERDLLIHTHISETAVEVAECIKKNGVSPVKYLEKLGLFEGKVLGAHCVALDADDIAILGRRKVGISHNPDSNLKLGTTICPVYELREAGARVGLGTDSTASNNNLDLLEEASLGSRLQTLKYGVGRVKAVEWVRMLTIEAARALHLDSEIGSLEVGKKADLICLGLSGWHAQPLYDPYSHVVFSAGGQDVRHCVVEGKVLMKDRKLLTIKAPALSATVAKWQKKISANR